MKRCMLCVVVTLVGVAGRAAAETNISTLPFGTTSLLSFGEYNTATFGQTITVPVGDSVLNRFSFWLDDFVDPDFIDFGAHVMAWDGSKATGPVLWSSTPQSTTNNGGLSGPEQFTFDTGGLFLMSGGQYVLFLSASDYFDGSLGHGLMPAGSTLYDGGRFVYLNNGSDFSLVTMEPWSASQRDAAFEAQFSSHANVVPAPAAILLGSLGTGLVSWLRRRRSL